MITRADDHEEDLSTVSILETIESMEYELKLSEDSSAQLKELLKILRERCGSM